MYYFQNFSACLFLAWYHLTGATKNPLTFCILEISNPFLWPTFCILEISNPLLWPTFCILEISNPLLWLTFCILEISNPLLWPTFCILEISNPLLWPTFCILEISNPLLWPTVKTQMKCYRLQQFIRVCAVCEDIKQSLGTEINLNFENSKL